MSIVQFGAGVVVCSVACMVRYSNTDNCSPFSFPGPAETTIVSSNLPCEDRPQLGNYAKNLMTNTKAPSVGN